MNDIQKKRSDIDAKEAYCKYLEDRGFSAEIKQAPADIRAVRDGQEWFFEIKKTSRNDVYFGAATMTEWEQAFKDPDHYRFVICRKLSDGDFEFTELTPEQMMEYSTIPPYKVFFSIPLDGRKKKLKGASKALRLSKEVFEALSEVYHRMKDGDREG